MKQARDKSLPTALITDAGHTQVRQIAKVPNVRDLYDFVIIGGSGKCHSVGNRTRIRN